MGVDIAFHMLEQLKCVLSGFLVASAVRCLLREVPDGQVVRAHVSLNVLP